MITVYVGPTLGAEDRKQLPDDLVIKSPLKHGDLLRAQHTSADVVVILDGLYHHELAARHKEILHLLAAGATVIGAASIGALRAAELAAYGMVGVGRIYEGYASGALVSDDEVSVAHTDDEDWKTHNTALVNLRVIARQAQSEGVLDDAQEPQLISLYRSVYYPQRTVFTAARCAERLGATGFEPWIRKRLAIDKHFGNQKRADALDAIELAQKLHADRQVRPGEGLRPESAWKSAHFRDWVNHFHADHACAETQTRLQYQQIFEPDFGDVWWAFMQSASRSAGDGRGASIEDRLTRLYGPRVPSDPLERRRLGCKIFRPRPNLGASDTRELLLSRETPMGVARLETWLEANTRFAEANPRVSTARANRSTAYEILADLWGTDLDNLEDDAELRGLYGETAILRAVSPFLIGYLQEVRIAAANRNIREKR